MLKEESTTMGTQWKAGEEPLPNWGKEAFFGKDLLKSFI